MTAVPEPPVHAGDVVGHTLLNCVLREISGPERRTAITGGYLLLRLPRCGIRLRVRLRRLSRIGSHRFHGPVAAWREGAWTELTWHALATCIARELRLRTGVSNDEFLDQVAASHATIDAALALPRPRIVADPYLDSEQSLLLGHRFHPTPKARGGPPDSGWRYAPEAGARFPLHHLAVRHRRARQECATPGGLEPLDRLGAVPHGYVLLPVHPWQYAMLRDHPVLLAAIRRGDVLDLGPRGAEFAPTASVRTVYDGRTFLKCSLTVRITNCLRTTTDHELRGAVALTRILEPVAADLTRRFPGTELLREPAYRTLDLGCRELDEGFGVIVREGLGARLAPGRTALLAAAVADEYPLSGAQVGRLLGGGGPERATAWWHAYLALLVPPVLAAYFDHGVVLEPHLQNVLVAVDREGIPRQVLFRDHEGTRLLPGRHAPMPAGLDPDVADALAYDPERGWNRVVYCLLVNHLADMLAALADRHPALEPELWTAVHRVLAQCSLAHGDPPPLRALVAGAPLPAKASLLTRWQRRADRDAEYVDVASPLAREPSLCRPGGAPW